MLNQALVQKAVAPTAQDLHVETLLNNLVVAQMQDLSAGSALISGLYPTIPVQFESDRYAYVPPGEWYRTEVEQLAPLSETPGSDFTIDNTRRYLCKEYGEHVDLSERQIQNCDTLWNLGQMVSDYLAQKMILKRHIQFKQTYLQPGVWQGFVDPTTKTAGDWNMTSAAATGMGGYIDTVTCDLPKMIRYITTQVQSTTGQRLTSMVCSRSVYNAMTTSYILRDYFKYVTPGVLPEALIAQALGLEKIVVFDTVYNFAAKGQADAMGFLAGDFFLLTYDNANQGTLMKPTAAATFEWQRYNNAVGGPVATKIIPLPLKAGYRYEVRGAWDVHLINPQMGVFCGNPLSTSQPSSGGSSSGSTGSGNTGGTSSSGSPGSSGSSSSGSGSTGSGSGSTGSGSTGSGSTGSGSTGSGSTSSGS